MGDQSCAVVLLPQATAEGQQRSEWDIKAYHRVRAARKSTRLQKPAVPFINLMF